MKPILMLVVACAMLGGCQTIDEAPSRMLGEATMTLASGAAAGTARLFASGTETTLSLSLSGLPEGWHGVHFHGTGSCERSDFTSAGPHPNPVSRQHGFEDPEGAHLGNLPNAVIGFSGSGTVSAILHGPPQEVLSQIFDADGTAIVVHAASDDDGTAPSGNPGSRIACGVLVRR